MTCIAAVTDGKTVWMGGDALVMTDLRNFEANISPEKKVFIRQDAGGTPWAIGSAGSARRAQLLRYELECPPFDHKTSADPLEFIIKKFVPALQSVLHRKRGDNLREDPATATLVGVGGNLFLIHHYWNCYVASIEQSFAVSGSGGPVAKGALYATEGTTLSPQERILLALEAAEAFNAGVKKPFTIVNTSTQESISFS